jgi:D-lactate dehydrogenase
VDACVARNVRVMRVPTYSPHAVAEFAWSTLLTLVRKVHKANARLKEQNFSLGGLIGGNINGKVVGVVGTGAIGRVFAQIASGFGCKILAFDVFPDKTLETSIPSFKYVTLDEVVQQADFVSLHVPLLPSTKHLVNAELLRKFKKGSILVNTSRGALVDTKAVIGALQSKVLGGYCADVYEKESTLFFQDQSGRILEDEFDDLAILNSMANGEVSFFDVHFCNENGGKKSDFDIPLRFFHDRSHDGNRFHCDEQYQRVQGEGPNFKDRRDQELKLRREKKKRTKTNAFSLYSKSVFRYKLIFKKT